MSVVKPEHLELIQQSLSELLEDHHVNLDAIRFGELVIVATKIFRSLMELNPNRPFSLANIAAEETFDDYLEYLEDPPAPTPPVYCLADDVVARRIDRQSYETIAQDLQIEGGADEAKKIFKQHFQGFDIQAVRQVLLAYEPCERVLLYLRFEKDMKPGVLVDEYPDEVLGLLQRYDSEISRRVKEGLKLNKGQQAWLDLRKAGTSVGSILKERPDLPYPQDFPGDMVVAIVTNRLQTIRNSIRKYVPDFGE
jgi:hypothetical protein